MMKLIKDMFYGPNNEHLDLGRVATGIVIAVIIFVVQHNAHLGAIDLMALGALFTGGLGPCAGWIAAKAYERRQIEKSKNEVEVAVASGAPAGEAGT